MARKFKRVGASHFNDASDGILSDILNSPSLPHTHESVRQAIYSADDLFENSRYSNVRRNVTVRWSHTPVRRPVRIVRNRYLSLRKLYMSAPSRVRFCIRRKDRREVLFARKVAGFSGTSRGTRYRRNGNSAYSCKTAF